MDTIKFNAKNIKCMGCVNTIQQGLVTLTGVDKVEVDLQGHVTVTGQGLITDELIEKLAELGYPLA